MKSASVKIAAMLFMLPAATSAATIQADFSGYLYQVSSSVSSRFSLGDVVSGHIILDTAASPQFWSNNFSVFPGAVKSGKLTVNGYTVVLGSGARAFISDDEDYGNGPIDRFIVDDYSASAASVNGLSFNDIFFNWQDNSGLASVPFELPNSQARFDAYSSVAGAIDWLRGDGQNRVTYTLTSVSIKNLSVPEPASWAMLLAGFGIVGIAVRRRNRLQPAI